MTELEKNNLLNRNQKIIDIIMNQIKKECPNSIDMIAIAGSFCSGDFYEKSDLDLVIIANDDKANCLNQCFILKDVAMDIYTSNWSSLEEMSKYSTPYVTKIIDLNIIYTRNDEILNHYKELQQTLLHNMNDDNLIKRNIEHHFNLALLELTKLNQNTNDLSLAYQSLGTIVKRIEFILYLLNKTYFQRGTKRIPQEITQLKILPPDFLTLYNNILNCQTIKEIQEKSNNLIDSIANFLNIKKTENIPLISKLNNQEKKEITPNDLYGTYEEIYSNWKNKMSHATLTNNQYLSFDTMNSCQAFYNEMSNNFLIPKLDLMKDYKPNDLFSNEVIFNKAMDKWLELYKKFNIEINYYDNLEELENMYNKSINKGKVDIMTEQNIYDNEEFFKGYQSMRQNKGSTANDLIETPQLFELIDDVKDKTILDLGCGTGGNAKKLIELGAKKVIGIDLSTKMIEVATEENKLPNIEYKVMSMNEINKLDEKLDLVVSSLAIHYIEDYNGLCQKVYKLLNDGGKFIFSHGHPMDSAPILNDYSKNFVIINDKKYFLLSDYNNEGKRTSHWFVDGVETYHRNMGHLVNGLIDAGFTLEKLLESYTNEAIAKINPSYEDQKDHSYYVYFKAKK